MEEVWKDVPGYEGLYEVSNLGRVRSLNYQNTGKSNIRIPFTAKNGYMSIRLSKDNKTRGFYIHRLVALVFVDNPNGWTEVNHKDEDKTNNRSDNLEWCTRKYNMVYGTGHKRSAEAQAGRTNTKSSKRIAQYDFDGNLIFVFPSASEVKRKLGYNRGRVCECARGECKQAYGYIWRYE